MKKNTERQKKYFFKLVVNEWKDKGGYLGTWFKAVDVNRKKGELEAVVNAKREGRKPTFPLLGASRMK